MADCQHKYCVSYLDQDIIYKVSRFENVQCPNENCKQVLDEKSKCYSQLPLDVRKKYNKLKRYIQTLKDPNIKLCPINKCEGFLKVQQSQQEGIIKIVNPKYTQCKEVCCSKCFFPKHQGNCQINDNTLIHVTSRQWPNLTFLRIQDNKLTIAGLEKLIFKQWPNLISINLNNKIISEVGIILVARELNCSIKHSGHYWNNFIYLIVNWVMKEPNTYQKADGKI